MKTNYKYYLDKPIPNRPLSPPRNTIKGRKQGRPQQFVKRGYFEKMFLIVKLKLRRILKGSRV